FQCIGRCGWQGVSRSAGRSASRASGRQHVVDLTRLIRRSMRFFKRYFVTGLLIWIPLVITVWVIALLIGTLESFVPAFLSSQSLFGLRIPGFQVVLVLLVVFLTGMFAANFIGQAMVDQWEQLLGRIPLVRSI